MAEVPTQAPTKAVTPAADTPGTLQSDTEPSGAVTLTLAGRLDTDAAATIWSQAHRSLPAGGQSLTVDASGLDYCDGAGIALLLDLECLQSRRGGSFQIQGLKRDLQELLHMSQSAEDVDHTGPCPPRTSVFEHIGKSFVSLLKDCAELLTYVGLLVEAALHAVLRPRRQR